MLHTLFFDLIVVAVFAIMISVLVAAHELGHYIFARCFGMGVEEFAVGFGKPILVTYYRKQYTIQLSHEEHLEAQTPPTIEEVKSNRAIELVNALEGSPKDRTNMQILEENGKKFLREITDFTVRAWLFGGFVRIKGMLPEEDGRETSVPGGFYSKGPLARLMVLFAGPLFSVIAGIAMLIPFYMVVGKTVAVTQPIIGGIGEGSPADVGGLKLGDKVVKLDGKPISDFFQMVEQVRTDGGKPMKFEVDRAGKTVDLTIIPILDTTPSLVIGEDLMPTSNTAIQSRIGVGSLYATQKLNLLKAFVEATLVPVDTVTGLVAGFAHPSGLKNEVGGPETMVRLTAVATQTGIWSILNLAGLLSISLGVLNLLPVPPLDGGQMAIAFAELLRNGKRLSLQVQGIVFTTGLALVGVLVLTIIAIDFQRNWSGSGMPKAQQTPISPKKNISK